MAGRKPDAKPTLDLSAYAGAYAEPAYGEARLTFEGVALKVKWGRFTMALEHLALDTFRLAEVPEFLSLHGKQGLVVFRLKEGAIEGMHFLEQEFRRVK